MGQLLSALWVVVLGLTAISGILLLLYWLGLQMPGRARERWHLWVVFLGPALLFLVVGLVLPAVRTFVNSFLGDQPGDPFVWFDNYVAIFENESSRTSLINTFLWVIGGTALSTIFGLTIARLSDRMRGEAWAKALIFLPTAVSLAGAGVIWKFVYQPPPSEVGLLNAITGRLGLGNDHAWLVEGWPRNTFFLIVILVWVQTGFATVVFSAAIKGVPDSLLEAARVDGATERQVLFRVTLPYIRSTIITVMTTTVIAALKVFDIIKGTTNGNFKTSTIANDVYDSYFIQGRPNYGSALAVILFLLVVPVVIINQRSQTRAREIGA